MCTTLKPIAGLEEDAESITAAIEFAHHAAQIWPLSNITPEDASKAARYLRNMFVLRSGGLPEDAAVPIHQLMRVAAGFERWAVPTTVPPEQVRTAADLVVGTVQDTGSPLLLAFPDEATIASAVRAGELQASGSLHLSGFELLESWHRSQQGTGPIAGVVMHSHDSAGSRGPAAPFVPPLLPTMLGFCYSSRVEGAVRALGEWLTAGGGVAEAPVAAMQLIAQHPFGVLHHATEKSLLTRASGGGPLMITAVDMAIHERQRLQGKAGQYEALHCTLGMVTKALIKAGAPDGALVCFGRLAGWCVT